MVSRMFKLGFLNKLSAHAGAAGLDKKKVGKMLSRVLGPDLGPRPTLTDQIGYFFSELAKKTKKGTVEAIKGTRIPIK